MSFQLNKQDIDTVIKKFYNSPNVDDYNYVQDWYRNNTATYPDREYIMCVYLFLMAANIKQQYNKLTYDVHMKLIRDIRDLLDTGDKQVNVNRKIYFDYGSKAGYYR